MTIIHQPAALAAFLHNRKVKGHTIGFVPTMGALHNGHLNLIKFCADRCDITVCSIFVNPTQFNNSDDFQKYPNRREADIKMLANSGATVLFLPPVEAIYPSGLDHPEHYDLGVLETVLEGQIPARALTGFAHDDGAFIKRRYSPISCLWDKRITSSVW